jgi:hypothetical protein
MLASVFPGVFSRCSEVVAPRLTQPHETSGDIGMSPRIGEIGPIF